MLTTLSYKEYKSLMEYYDTHKAKLLEELKECEDRQQELKVRTFLFDKPSNEQILERLYLNIKYNTKMTARELCDIMSKEDFTDCPQYWLLNRINTILRQNKDKFVALKWGKSYIWRLK